MRALQAPGRVQRLAAARTPDHRPRRAPARSLPTVEEARMALEAPLSLGVFLANGGDPRSMLQRRFRLLCEEALLIEGLTDVERQQWAAQHRVSAAFWRAQPFTVGQGGEPVELHSGVRGAGCLDHGPRRRAAVAAAPSAVLHRRRGRAGAAPWLELAPPRAHLEHGPDQDQTRSAVDPRLEAPSGALARPPISGDDRDHTRRSGSEWWRVGLYAGDLVSAYLRPGPTCRNIG